MKQLNLIIAIAFMALSQSALASMKVTVNGMVCSFCAQGIEKTISRMDATKAVFVDLKGRFVLVEAKDGAALDQKAITAAIVDAGYDVLKVEISTMTVDQIKAASKSAIK